MEGGGLGGGFNQAGGLGRGGCQRRAARGGAWACWRLRLRPGAGAPGGLVWSRRAPPSHLDPFCGLRHHQVAVEEGGAVAPQGRDDGGAQREVGHKVAVLLPGAGGWGCGELGEGEADVRRGSRAGRVGACGQPATGGRRGGGSRQAALRCAPTPTPTPRPSRRTMTSMCSQSAPSSTMVAHSSASFEKSADRMEGDTTVAGRSRARCAAAAGAVSAASGSRGGATAAISALSEFVVLR